jgi:hypothetical protein
MTEKSETRRLLHGVGLLRISRNPITVDSEEYVVFVDGCCLPRTFKSYAEAFTYFIAKCENLGKRWNRPLRSRHSMQKGQKQGVKVFYKAQEKRA